MTELPSAFNANQEEGMGDFTPVPAGTYTAEITKSEIKDTKAGTGKYINLQWKIIEGDYAKRVIFDLINIVNPSETAVEIGRKRIKSICDAVGIISLTDTDQLHGKPIYINVVIKEDENYGPKNVIKKYESIDGNSNSSESDNPFDD